MGAQCAEKLTTDWVSRVQVVKLVTQRVKCQYQLVQVKSFNAYANFDSIIRFLAGIIENK